MAAGVAAGGVAVLLQDRATELRTAGRKMVVARRAAGREKKMALLFVVRRREDGVCCRIMVVADEDGGCRGLWCVAGEVGGGGCGGWKERRKLGLGFWEMKMMTWQSLSGQFGEVGIMTRGGLWLANFKRWGLPHGMIWLSGV